MATTLPGCRVSCKGLAVPQLHMARSLKRTTPFRQAHRNSTTCCNELQVIPHSYAYRASGVTQQDSPKEPSTVNEEPSTVNEEASTVSAVDVSIRPASPTDIWPAADVHCSVFYPRARPNAARLVRLDRVVALQQDKKLTEIGPGRAITLVATARSSGPPPSSLYPPIPPEHANPLYWLPALLNKKLLTEGLGTGSKEGGVLGLACLDSFGDKLPPKLLWEVEKGLYGRVGWCPRTGLAYISNVAVVEAARRQGVAAQLVASAEQLAREWGCRAVTLHVDPGNEPAYQLYRKLGYRKAVMEAAWMPFVMGRPWERRWLMMKIVKRG